MQHEGVAQPVTHAFGIPFKLNAAGKQRPQPRANLLKAADTCPLAVLSAIIS
jgi:hypothetical protein